MVVLYAGPADDLSIDSVIRQSIPADTEVLGIDICRSEDHDLLLPELYSRLCSLAVQGKLRGILGGPMCHTWSIRRPSWREAPPSEVAQGNMYGDCQISTQSTQQRLQETTFFSSVSFTSHPWQCVQRDHCQQSNLNIHRIQRGPQTYQQEGAAAPSGTLGSSAPRRQSSNSLSSTLTNATWVR